MESTTKPKDKTKIAIIVLSVLIAISLTTTIYFAAFTARRTGSLTLNFADGLTMRLDPLGKNGRIQFVAADENATTFNYTPVSNADTSVTLDGIDATINKDAWIAFKVELWETTSGTDVAPAEGSFQIISATRCQLRTGTTSWYAEMVKNNTDFTFALTSNSNMFTCSSNVKCSASASINLFEHFTIWGTLSSALREYANTLSGRSFKVVMTIKARTDTAPTF